MYLHKLIYQAPENKEVVIQLPASKSIANRLLILEKIAAENFRIKNLSTANDTILLKEILSHNEIPEQIDCQDAGTVLRFMICLCAATPNRTFEITGTPRLLKRPLQPLLDCLEQLGAQIELLQISDDLSVLKIVGQQLQHKELIIAGDVSSQFISGLCLISPLIKNGLSVTISEPILSKPYIDLTLKLLAKFNINSKFKKNRIQIPQQKITSTTISVEADWSSATFFYAFMILNKTCESLLLNGLKENDLQGDKYISEVCIEFGIQTTFNEHGALLSKKNHPPLVKRTIDLGNYPDLAVPLILASAFEHSEIKFTGLSHLRSKESDRITALQHNLENFDIVLNEENGTIWFEKREVPIPKNKIEIETFSDHRIAMSFSLLAVLGYEISLDQVSCIHKSFPGFLEQIALLGICIKN